MPLVNSCWHNRDLYSSAGTWAIARDGIMPTKWRSYQRPDNRIGIRTQLIATYHIVRGYLNFHTQGVGPVISARLGLYIFQNVLGTDSLIITKGLWDEPVTPEDWGIQTEETTVLGQIDLADIQTDEYNWIDLNQAGIDWINQRPIEINQFESCDWRKSTEKGLYQPYHQAMSFTPIVTHTIKHVRIRARRSGSPGTLYIYIKAAGANHCPTGPALATGSIDANTFTTTAAYGDWYLVTLATGLTLPAGTEYCIEWHAPDSNIDNYLALPVCDGSFYLNGIRCLSDDDGATWATAPDSAIYFIEYEEQMVGGTKFCLRASRDVNNTPPTSYQTLNILFHSAQKGVGYLPLLDLTYAAAGASASLAGKLVAAHFI